MVGGMSVLYLLSSAVLPLALLMVGLPLDTLELDDVLKRSAIGGLSLLCAFYLPCEDAPINVLSSQHQQWHQCRRKTIQIIPTKATNKIKTKRNRTTTCGEKTM